MYQIVRITDKEGVTKADPESQAHQGCIGEAKMEDGCMLIHFRYNKRREPCDRYIRTSLVKTWKKDKETGRIVVETLNTIYHLDPVKME